MRLTIYFKFYDDIDISMLFHSLTFVILCGSQFSSILQNGALCFFEVTFLVRINHRKCPGDDKL
jgi:hypothetical protein